MFSFNMVKKYEIQNIFFFRSNIKTKCIMDLKKKLKYISKTKNIFKSIKFDLYIMFTNLVMIRLTNPLNDPFRLK